LDALVATTPENIAYLSDFRALSNQYLRSPVFVVYPRDSEPALILPIGESADLYAYKMTWIEDIRPYGDFNITIPNITIEPWERELAEQLEREREPDAFSVLAQTLDEKGLKGRKIGIDENALTSSDLTKLASKLPQATIRPAADTFREIRMIKTKEELSRLKQVYEITEKSIEAVWQIAKAGAPMERLVQTFSTTVASLGGLPLAPSIAVGKASYLQNNLAPAPKKLERGDLLRFDVCCNYKYYYSDLGRNAVVAQPTDQQKKFHSAVFAGEQEIIKNIRPGAKIADLFQLGVETVKKHGIPHFKRHHCGHSIGLDLYDPPIITAVSQSIVQEGMVLVIETPYYEMGAGGFMVEDIVAVTKGGCEYISTLDRELHVT
jgi:Xaa-Pro dipeptidase